MKSNIIDIYYFSGTGNTLLMVKKLAEILSTYGKQVNLFKIEHTNPDKINLSHTIGLAFPVAVFSTYPFVWDFIENLPAGGNAEIFMLDALAGFSGGIVGPLKKILLNKGYLTLGACELIMPSNYGMMIPDSEKILKKITVAENKIKKYVKTLIEGQSKWQRMPLFSDLISFLSKMPQPWRTIGKCLSLDHNKCVKCRLCVQICPIAAIDMLDLPVITERCVACMRCIACCPKHAILYKGTTKRYRALNSDELVL